MNRYDPMEDGMEAVGVAALFFLGWFFSGGNAWALNSPRLHLRRAQLR